LHDGRNLAIKIVAAVASLFLQEGFSIVDVGPRGVGKTLTSSFAVHLFYDSREPFSLYSTQVAAERLFVMLRNLPILLDECALKSDESVENIVFMLASGKGKMRSNLSLSLRLDRIASTVFLTSEKEIEFSRLGARRRILPLHASSWDDYCSFLSPCDIVHIMQSYCGAGTDYILFLLQHYTEFQDREENEFSEYEKLYYTYALSRALNLLEKFYNEKFDEVRESLHFLLYQLNSEVSKDVCDIFLDKFIHFVYTNFANFIIFNSDGTFAKNHAPEDLKFVWGRIEIFENEQKIIILSEVLKKFCQENSLPLKLIITKMQEKNILVPDLSRNRPSHRIRLTRGAPPATCYVFSLPLDQEQEQQEQEQLSINVPVNDVPF